MKNKRTKLVFVVIFALLISFLLMTNVRAEITVNGDTVTIPCGENISTYVEIDDWIDTSGRAASMNQYSIINNEGIEIFTGWNQPMWQNNNNSYYGRMNVATDTIGQQTITIRFIPNGGSSVDTTLTVNCTGSDNLKAVIEAFGGSMPDAQTLNTDDAYTNLDGLTGTQYEAILDALDEYNALGDAEKTIVDNLLSDNLGMTMADAQQAADDGIEALANDFVNSSRLNEDKTGLSFEEERGIYENALTLGDEFDALSPRTQERVLAKLDAQSWDDVEEECRIAINIIDADKFLSDYIYNTDEIPNDEMILDGEETWNNLNNAVRSLINDALLEDEEIEKSYPELLLRAKANKFLADNLTTEDGKVIVEANNNNYKQILDAKDDYDALDDAVKDEVNKILTELGNTTYPQLLLDAQALAPTPKTGDVVVIAIIALFVSSLGIVATFMRKK